MVSIFIAFVFMLVILGMNFQWTPVGKYVTEGVQGRYFIPVVILLLIALIPPKKLSKTCQFHHIDNNYFYSFICID